LDHLDSVCPIFCDKEGERLYQIGSGVLIDFRSEVFLLTAAHVIDEAQNADLLIPHKDNQITCIEGMCAFNTTASREEDFLDFAYFKLDRNFSSDLRYTFYPVPEDEFGIQKVYNHEELFAFAGFPHRKSNVAGQSASTEHFSYGTYHASPSEYEALDCKTDVNIVTKFNRKESIDLQTGQLQLPVFPHGISGGGIFVWPRNMQEFPLKNRKLVGIGHTWKKEGYFIGTRLEMFLDAILINNPNLRDKT
jgi:hypothetical protein